MRIENLLLHIVARFVLLATRLSSASISQCAVSSPKRSAEVKFFETGQGSRSGGRLRRPHGLGRGATPSSRASRCRRHPQQLWSFHRGPSPTPPQTRHNDLLPKHPGTDTIKGLFSQICTTRHAEALPAPNPVPLMPGSRLPIGLRCCMLPI